MKTLKDGEVLSSDVRADSNIAAVDLFCGAGGLTRGLLDAGIDVRAGYDIDGDCRYPYEVNNGVPFVKRSVRTITAAEVKARLGEKPTIIAGCAPCQPFSILTNKSGGANDARRHLLTQFSRIVLGVRPDFVTMENVRGLASKRVFRNFVKRLKEGGYFVWHSVVDCAALGIPQRRGRLVLLASLHAPIALVRPDRPITRTVRDAIGSLPRLSAGGAHPTDRIHRATRLSETNLRRVRSSRPGGSWRDWPTELQLRCHQTLVGRSYVDAYGRMDWDSPAPTMTTKFYNLGSGRFGHPEDDRALTPREAAALQTFPVNYDFVAPGIEPTFSLLSKLIGNAVPVALGKQIGDSIVNHWAKVQRI